MFVDGYCDYLTLQSAVDSRGHQFAVAGTGLLKPALLTRGERGTALQGCARSRHCAASRVARCPHVLGSVVLFFCYLLRFVAFSVIYCFSSAYYRYL